MSIPVRSPRPAFNMLSGAFQSAQQLNPATEALIAAMSVPPSAARTLLINNCIVSLQGNGLWSKLDVLYMLAAHDEQAARLNWKAPGTFTCTAVNSPTFQADRGFTGDGATSYLNTGITLSTAGLPLYAQDSCHMGVWGLTNVSGAINAMGNSATAYIRPRSGANVVFRAQQSAATDTLPGDSNAVGHTVWSRNNALDYNWLKNGVFKATQATASAALGTGHIDFCGGNALNLSTQQIAGGHLGAGLTDAQVTSLYSILLAYMQAVGAA